MIGYALLTAEWLIRIGMTPVVVRKRGASASLAWLAFIYFIPWVGVVLYVLIGEIDIGKRRARDHAAVAKELREKLRERFLASPAPPPEIPEAQRDLEVLCRHVGGAPALGGNAAEPISDTTELIDRLVDEIDAAEHTVHLLYYIFGAEASGRRVAEALLRAAGRGVECRVLVDAVGSKEMLRRIAPGLRRHGVKCSPCLPVNPARRALARIDLRNHRKLAVFDGRVAYTGSHNLIEADYGQKKYGAWRDLSVRIEGPAVLELQAVFIEDWHVETREFPAGEGVFPETSRCGDTVIQIAPSGPADRPAAFRWLAIAALHEAQERVVITSPYMALDESMLSALRVTAMRGVTVEIVLPERTNHPLVAAASYASFDDLLGTGVRIHLHQSGLLHAKTMTVDEAFVLGGSGNFDIRSFLLNFELNSLYYGPAATRLIRAEQEQYIAQSRELTPEEWARRKPWRKTTDRLAMLASPLL